MNTFPPPNVPRPVPPIPKAERPNRRWIVWLCVALTALVGVAFVARIGRAIQTAEHDSAEATDVMWQAAWDDLSVDKQFAICEVVTGQSTSATRDDLITDDSSENFVKWVEDHMNEGLCAN